MSTVSMPTEMLSCVTSMTPSLSTYALKPVAALCAVIWLEAKVVIREVTKAASKVMDRAKAVEVLATNGVAMVEEAVAIAVAVAISITTIVATMAEVVTAVAKIMDLVAILTLSRAAGQATIRWEEEEVVVV